MSKLPVIVLSVALAMFLSLSVDAQLNAQGSDFYQIPSQHLDLLKYSDYDFKYVDDVPKTEISSFITLGEYKAFLDAVKRDSSEVYYLKRLPDSVVTYCSEIYSKYLNDNQYEKYPVVGISWESALAYCEWRTKIEQYGGEMTYYYRLPLTSEWISAYSYFEENKIENDFAKTYSDLLYCGVDGTIIGSKMSPDNVGFQFDFVYYHKPDDSKVLQRKRIIGSNFKFAQNVLLNNTYCLYADKGAVYVSFRVVKVDFLREEKFVKYFNF